MVVHKTNQFFMLYNNTLRHQKLRLVSVHIEGKAMVWHQDLENSDTLVHRETFAKAFLVRFWPSPYDESMETLTRLRQVGSVEYKVKFETVSNRLRQLSE